MVVAAKKRKTPPWSELDASKMLPLRDPSCLWKTCLSSQKPAPSFNRKIGKIALGDVRLSRQNASSPLPVVVKLRQVRSFSQRAAFDGNGGEGAESSSDNNNSSNSNSDDNDNNETEVATTEFDPSENVGSFSILGLAFNGALKLVTGLVADDDSPAWYDLRSIFDFVFGTNEQIRAGTGRFAEKNRIHQGILDDDGSADLSTDRRANLANPLQAEVMEQAAESAANHLAGGGLAAGPGGVVGGGVRRGLRGAGAAKKIPTPKMKSSPFGPKIEDVIPRGGVPKNWSRSDIADAITDYEASIASRYAEQRAFDAAGTGSATERLAHARRIAQEEAFLASLRKALENRR